MIPSFRQQSERDISFSPPTFELRAQKMCSITKKNGADYPIPHHLTQKFVPPNYTTSKIFRNPQDHEAQPSLLFSDFLLKSARLSGSKYPSVF